MEKRNCWQHKKCGRESGGAREGELGTCPASTEQRLDGIHGGKNAGRACWVIAGTYCDGKVQGTYAEKERNCLACDFHRMVRSEESQQGEFKMLPDLLMIIMS